MSDNEQENNPVRSDLVTLKEVYCLSVLVSPKSVPQFKFYEDLSVNSGLDRYLLLDADQDTAIFHVSGTLIQLSVTAASAVEHRKPDAKLDEYTVRLRIEDSKVLKEIEEGLHALTDLLKNTEKACENISVSSALVPSRLSFKMEDVKLKVSNYAKDIFYFNRKVATRDNVPTDDGHTPDFLLNFPAQGPDYPSLMYPSGWSLIPLIAVTDVLALEINPENIELPRPGTVYFEFKQGSHNFEGKEGNQVKQIVLIPTIIAVKVHPHVQVDDSIQKAKRRRVSC